MRRTFRELLILQQVTDLGQQNFLSRGCGRCSGLFGNCFLFLLLAQLSQLVQALDQPEHNQGQDGKVDDCGDEVANYLTWGNFLSAVINFFILALVVFFIVKGLNKLSEIGKKKEEEAAAAEPPAPPAPSNEEVLLGEIRDLLKNK